MAQKKKQSSQRSSISLVALSLLLITALIAVIIWGFNGNKEGEMVMSLREDMKALQVEFNKIDDGWVYSESCRSQGGKYAQDEPSSCNMSIIISSLGRDQSSSFEQYKGIISLNEKFKVDSNNRQYNAASQDSEEAKGMAVTFYPSYALNPNCELIIYDRTGKISGVVTCTTSASEFYFPRNDL